MDAPVGITRVVRDEGDKSLIREQATKCAVLHKKTPRRVNTEAFGSSQVTA
jgi:hypothetical protein